jgi:hypothetical protein
MSLLQKSFNVIPGLTRNPDLSRFWIQAFAETTAIVWGSTRGSWQDL